MFKKSLVLFMVVALLVGMCGTGVFAGEKVRVSKKFGTPEFVSGQLTNASNETPENILFNYFNGNKAKFKFSGKDAKDAFKVTQKGTDKLGYTYIRVQQMYNGIPVFGSTQIANIKEDGVLTSVSGAVIPELENAELLKLTKRIGKGNALDAAVEDLGFTPEYNANPTSELVVYALDGQAKYAYHVELNFSSPEAGMWNYFVDAVDGTIINKYNEIQSFKGGGGGGGVILPPEPTGTNQIGIGTGINGETLQFGTILDSTGTYYMIDKTRGDGIITFDGANSTKLPGSYWADADNAFNTAYDAAAVDSQYNLAQTYDYYLNTFGRNSFDGNGAAMKSTVHYGVDYNNAYWNGVQMVFGDGDGNIFIELSGAMDVVAHEFTHAVTSYTADLIYQNESGAVNESMSDIFGTAVEFYANDNPDWLIGEDIVAPGFPYPALRNVEDPASIGDPDHYTTRYTGTDDYGGVHINACIVGKAAQLMAMGGTHYNVTVTGIGMNKMEQIFYRALTQHLTASSGFSATRAAVVQSAIDLYGSTSQEVQSTNDAFDAIGVY